MPWTQDIAQCLAAHIGAGGLDDGALAAALARCRPALDGLRRARAADAMPFLALPERADDIAEIEALAAESRGALRDVAVFGAGGSSLGGRALCALAAPGARPRVRFADNLDSRGFAALMAELDPARTLFLVVSKSGGTAETLAQFLAAWEWARAGGGADAARRAFVVLCRPGGGPLRRLALRRGLRVIDHDPELGGRYSVLSPVGLAPAACAGLNARAARAGAAEVLHAALAADDPRDSPPALGAAVQVALAETRGVRIVVTMPYCDRLAPFASWFGQLWAESLGKDGKGTAPVAALGPRDQHSQLQLWRDGPADKAFTLISVDADGSGPRVPAGAAEEEPGLAWLAGAAFDDAVLAMARATADSLAAAGRPVRRIRLPALDERALGGLFMHFMLETVIAARLLGVDPFDQPAVEHGKRLARRYLGERRGRAA